MSSIDRQRRQMGKDVAWLITQSGMTASVIRPQVSNSGSFYGPTQQSETIVGDIPLEMQSLKPADLAELGADAVAHVLTDSNVLEQDVVVVQNVRYRVTNVKPHNCFGTITHLELHLERDKRSVSHG